MIAPAEQLDPQTPPSSTEAETVPLRVPERVLPPEISTGPEEGLEFAPETVAARAKAETTATDAAITKKWKDVGHYAAEAKESTVIDEKAFQSLSQRTWGALSGLLEKIGIRKNEPPALETPTEEAKRAVAESDVEQAFFERGKKRNPIQELAKNAELRAQRIEELVAQKDKEGLRAFMETLRGAYETVLTGRLKESRAMSERMDYWRMRLGKPLPAGEPATLDLILEDMQKVRAAITTLEQPELPAPPEYIVEPVTKLKPGEVPIELKPKGQVLPDTIELEEQPAERSPGEIELDREAVPEYIEPELAMEYKIDVPAGAPEKPATLAERKAAANAPIEIPTELKLTPLLDALRNETLARVENRLRELDRLAGSSEARTKAGLSTRAVEAEAMLLLDQKRELRGDIIPLDTVRGRIAALEDGLRNIDEQLKSASPEKRRVLEAESAALDRERTELFRYLNRPYELTIAEEAAIPRAIEIVQAQAAREATPTQPVSGEKTPEALLAETWYPLMLEMEAVPKEGVYVLYERKEEFVSALRDALGDASVALPKLEVPVVSLDRTRAERAYKNDMELHIALAAEYFFLRERQDLSQAEQAQVVAIETKISGRKGGNLREILWFKHRARITEADRLYIENEIIQRYQEMKRSAQSGYTMADTAAE